MGQTLTIQKYEPLTIVERPPDTAPAPFNAPRIAQGRGTQIDLSGKNRAENTQMFKNNAPAILGTAAAGMTGGLSVPIQAGIMATAAGVGQLIKDTQWDMPLQQRVDNSGKAALGSGLLTFGVGRAAEGLANRVTPDKMRAAASDMWLSAAKITKPTARQTQTMRMGGSLNAGKEEIAETVLRNQAGPIGAKSAEALRDVLAFWDDKLDAAIAASKKFMDRDELEQALVEKTLQIGMPGSAADAKMLNALHDAYVTVSQLPRRIPVQLAQAKKQAIYRAWNYAAEAADSFTAQADKLLGRTYRSGVAAAEPAAVPANAEISKLRPAVSGMDEAISRTKNLDPVGLSKMLFGLAKGSVSSVLMGGAATINDPRVGSWTAQKIYNLAQRLPKGYLTPANIIRVLSEASKGESSVPVETYPVKDPKTGEVFHYRTQADADKAKKAAGIR